MFRPQSGLAFVGSDRLAGFSDLFHWGLRSVWDRPLLAGILIGGHHLGTGLRCRFPETLPVAACDWSRAFHRPPSAAPSRTPCPAGSIAPPSASSPVRRTRARKAAPVIRYPSRDWTARPALHIEEYAQGACSPVLPAATGSVPPNTVTVQRQRPSPGAPVSLIAHLVPRPGSAMLSTGAKLPPLPGDVRRSSVWTQ